MSGPLSALAKRIRRGIKEPLQSGIAWAAVQPLDTRPRSIDEVRALTPRAIVASRTDRIGDMLVSTAMIAALHRKWPEARLVVIPGPRNRAALEGLPFVEAGPPFGSTPTSWVRLSRWLVEQKFDLAVSLQAEAMSGVMIAAWSGAPVRIATHATKAAHAFNFLFGLDEERHHVTRFCRAAAMLGAPCAEPRPVYLVSSQARELVKDAVTAWSAGGPVVGIQVPNRTSARHRARAWPAERLEALVRDLAARGRQVVLFAFGPEMPEAERLRAAVPAAAIAPPVPLAQTAALLEHVDVFVSGYTGTYHLADAVGACTVLTGSAHYAEYWRALGPAHRHALADTAADVPLDAVRDAVESLIALKARQP